MHVTRTIFLYCRETYSLLWCWTLYFSQVKLAYSIKQPLFFVEGYHIEHSYPLHHLRSLAYIEAAVLYKMDGKLPPLLPPFKDADAGKWLGGGG